MGKIRVATLGVEEEDKLREEQKVKREEKKKREVAKKVRISGMKGGERIKTVGAESEEELERLAKLAKEAEKAEAGVVKEEPAEETKKKIKVWIRSKRYKQVLMKVNQNQLYPIGEAITLLRQVSLTKFDGTVELHINTVEKGLRGSVMLPHGTGKKTKVMIANADNVDKLSQDVEKGKIDFDVLIAHPQAMPKLAKVARYLGPKGLMPNPKAGTISLEPEKVAERLQGGEVNWKTESEFPILHQIIGKLSFKDIQLVENFETLVKSIGATKIKSVILKSTMSPGIKVRFS